MTISCDINFSLQWNSIYFACNVIPVEGLDRQGQLLLLYPPWDATFEMKSESRFRVYQRSRIWRMKKRLKLGQADKEISSKNISAYTNFL
jgi:hypothetical protein